MKKENIAAQATQVDSDKISLKTMLAYGTGNMGITMVWSTISTFLTIYLTDSVGIAAGTVGSIMLISRIFDGFSDVFMGSIVDKTHTRWGKARPLLFWLSIPLAITFVLLFSVPSSLTGGAKVVYVIITYNLVTTIFYTACSIPYGTLLPLLSRNQISVSNANIVRTAMGSVATLACSFVTLKIVNAFPNSAQGWTAMAILYGLFLVITTGITFFNTEEKLGSGAAGQKKEEKIPVKTAIKLLFQNKYLIIIALFSVVLSVNNFPGLNAYYAKYILEDENIVGLMTFATMVPAFVMMAFMPALIKRFGKRNCSIGGFVIYLAGCAVAFIDPNNATVVLTAMALRGLGIAPAFLSQYAFIADTVVYGEWKTGKRTEGLINSVCPFGNKLGTGLGTVIVSWSMAFAGYDGLLAQQPESALQAIQNVFIYVPIVIGVVSIILLYFYRLDQQYNDILKDLAKEKN